MSILTKNKPYVPRDIRNLFPEISRQTTMLYSEGSVEVKMGRYVEEDDIKASLDKIRNYRFI
ncbi:MAG: hypothetical protein LBH98_01275 [Chitinispirillales bacterium]|nr:hypothetical protein [Chitinispirillales bacterium]